MLRDKDSAASRPGSSQQEKTGVPSPPPPSPETLDCVSQTSPAFKPLSLLPACAESYLVVVFF